MAAIKDRFFAEVCGMILVFSVDYPAILTCYITRANARRSKA